MKFVIPSCPNMSKQKNKHMLVVLTFDVSYVMFVFIVLPSCILDDVNNACVKYACEASNLLNTFTSVGPICVLSTNA